MTLTFLRTFFQNPSVPRWRKFAAVAAVAYVVLPLDFIPDVIPVLGWLDDIGILALAYRMISTDVARIARRPASVEVIDGQVTHTSENVRVG
jgi:uncharacterized membrane protein YkvA (DUF1232 family)